MTFAWPHLFWLLAVPAVWLAWDLTHRRRTAAITRPKILRAEAGAHSLTLAGFDSRPSNAARPRYWLCLGLALCVIGLARPQYGKLEEPVFDQSREILIAIDLSRSMLTPDVKPSRLERAKLLIQSLLEKLKGERVGLAVFSGTAFLQSPLSADYEILREFLPALGPDFLPEGGSNYGAMLDTALQAFGASGAADRFLIVLSDGEATDDDWKGKMEELKKKSIRVIGLGVGTSAGGMIPDASGQFVKDERGAVVLSKLEPSTLLALTEATGGVYRDASAWVDLAALVNETIESGRKGQFVEKNTVRLAERFQWPLAFGLWCLFVSFCYEFPVRPRPRPIALTPGDTGNRTTAAAKAAATLAVLLAVASLLYPVSSFAATPPSAASPATATPPEPPALSKIVGRLAAAETHTARDWAELGRETTTWGSKLQSEQQEVPEGPVRDALKAVDLGTKLDAKAADWPKLREELQALLKKSDEDKEQKKDDQDKNDQEQDKEQKDQDQKSQKQKQDKNGKQQQKSPQDQKDSSEKQEPSEKKDEKPAEQKPPGESAFGDMNKKEEPPPPPPPQSTQKVGGAQEKKDEQKEALDPSLALPLQKLDQLRSQDSPAQLFQLMEGERKGTKKPAKDW